VKNYLLKLGISRTLSNTLIKQQVRTLTKGLNPVFISAGRAKKGRSNIQLWHEPKWAGSLAEGHSRYRMPNEPKLVGEKSAVVLF
jgi:hypothetical protein